MKRLIFISVLVAAIALSSYGKGNDKDVKLLHKLTTASGKATTSTRFGDGEFKSTTFPFNNKKVQAFYEVETNNLIGFSIPLTQNDLPAGAIEDIEKKYAGYNVTELIMFIYESGFFGFYVSLSHPVKKGIVVDVNRKGKAQYYTSL